MTDSFTEPEGHGADHDQDAEPPLTGPGTSGPTGVDETAEDGALGGGNPDAVDQDAQPSQNAPEA